MTPASAVDVRDPPRKPASVPTRIGRFQIREEIGRGSNGVVYAATDPVLGRDVAIKAIPLGAQYSGNKSAEADFLQEAKIAAGLNHPSIVTVFDAGKTDDLAYIAMERLHGADLHHWLLSNRTMSAEGAAALIARVCDAVHFAHRRGLIHRDIKPSNIFLGRDMKPKVLDFGIALAQGQQGNPNEPRKLIGTPNYMSPEQALGMPLDARSDIFSIGAILYELLAGQRAFDGGNVDEILTKVVKVEPPSVTGLRPEVPAVMGEIIARALAKDPAQRYQTTAQLRNDLASFAGRPVSPLGAPGDLGITAMSRARTRLPSSSALIATGAALAGLTLIFALWNASRGGDTDAATAPPAPAQASAAANPAAAAAHPTLPVPGARSDASRSAPHPGDAGNAGPGGAAKAASKSLAATAARRRPPAPPVVAPPPPAPPVEPGALSLAIIPWGEVYVDGTRVGVAPPLNQLSLPAGPHTIEVRNGSAASYTAQIDVESGKTLKLQHRF